jgi:hypothetical protein
VPEEARVRSGLRTPAALLAVAAAVVVLVNAVPKDDPGDPPTPRASITHREDVPFEVPVVAVTHTRLSTSIARGPDRPCDSTHCCPTQVRTFGSDAPIARVIAHFQALGYGYAAPPLISQGAGNPKTSGTYLRWLGELPGDRIHWRLVNVATGPTAEQPGWRTVFEVSRAVCTDGAAPPPEDWPRH